VKTKKHFFLSLLLLQVFMMTSPAEAFTFSTKPLDFGSRQGDYFRADQNRKAFLFEENTSDLNFQNQSEKDNDGVSFYSNLNFSHHFPGIAGHKTFVSGYIPNRRTILKTQIFPFHFFW